MYTTKDELHVAFKAGEITADVFIAQLESLTNKELQEKETLLQQAQEELRKAQGSKLEKSKTLDLHSYVDSQFNEAFDARILVDMCALLVQYAESATGYKANIKSIEDKFPGLTFSKVLQAFSALGTQRSKLFPCKKASRNKFTLNGQSFTVNEYIAQQLLQESVPTPITTVTTSVEEDF
jgi:tryptophanyl-tRNA synthetase